jgi:hypothetical protein
MKWMLGIAVVLGLGGLACSNPNSGPDPQLKWLAVLMPGFDTVLVDVESGDPSGPITLFSSADFSAEFYTATRELDPRVIEQTFRLDVTPADTGIVKFSRVGQFTGSLNKIATGNTTIRFTLVRLADTQTFFNLTVPTEVH